MKREVVPVASLYLSVAAAVMFRLFLREGGVQTTRELLFGGLCGALVVGVVLLCVMWVQANLVQPLQRASHQSRVRKESACVGGAVLSIFLFGASVVAGWQQVVLYSKQFGGGALWVILLAVGVCYLHCTQNALGRCAGVLLVLCAICALCFLLGVRGQLDWRNLSAQPLQIDGLRSGFAAGRCLYPEYLLLVFMPSKGQRKKLFALPLFVVLLQVVFAFLAELVFAEQGQGLLGNELLQVWSFFSFTRFDAIVVLLWVMLAMFRMRLLLFYAQNCWRFARRTMPAERGEV